MQNNNMAVVQIFSLFLGCYSDIKWTFEARHVKFGMEVVHTYAYISWFIWNVVFESIWYLNYVYPTSLTYIESVFQ
jgi:hypothetical protein